MGHTRRKMRLINHLGRWGVEILGVAAAGCTWNWSEEVLRFLSEIEFDWETINNFPFLCLSLSPSCWMVLDVWVPQVVVMVMALCLGVLWTDGD